MNTINDFEEIDVSQIFIGVGKKGQRGNITANIYYKTPGTPLRMKTPRLRVPFGFSMPKDAPGWENSGVKLALSFSSNSGDKIREFEEKIMEIDQRLFQQVVERQNIKGSELITKKLNESNCNTLRRPHEQPDKYSPLIKAKVDTKVVGTEKETIIDLEIYDKEGNLIPPAEVTPGGEVRTVLEISYVYIISVTNWGFMSKVKQIKFYPGSSRIVGNVFEDNLGQASIAVADNHNVEDMSLAD